MWLSSLLLTQTSFFFFHMGIEVTAPFDGAFDFMELCYDIGFYFERNMLLCLIS